MIGITGLLLDGDLAPQHREYAEMIRASGEALLAIINDLVESTLELWAKLTLAKDIELASAIKTRLRGDPRRVRQILTNLIGNALKFASKGEVVVRVSKGAETENPR